jgi:hypothetical protein
MRVFEWRLKKKLPAHAFELTPDGSLFGPVCKGSKSTTEAAAGEMASDIDGPNGEEGLEVDLCCERCQSKIMGAEFFTSRILELFADSSCESYPCVGPGPTFYGT